MAVPFVVSGYCTHGATAFSTRQTPGSHKAVSTSPCRPRGHVLKPDPRVYNVPLGLRDVKRCMSILFFLREGGQG